jgi:exosome complex RNA-binding protein Rrp4
LKYIAKTGDQVVGIIEERTADFYKVNIFSDSTALLNRLAFEGATKRNKPELKIGDTIYCRVGLAHKDLETELTCVSASGSKKGWSTGEAVSPFIYLAIISVDIKVIVHYCMCFFLLQYYIIYLYLCY